MDKYNEGMASPAEAALLQYWFIHEASREEVSMQEKELQQVMMNMRKNIVAQTKPKVIKLWPRIAAVATAMVAVTLSVWLYYSNDTISRTESEAGSKYTNDVAPGKNRATLTFADGKIINLSDAKTGLIIAANSLKYNDSSLVQGSVKGSPGDHKKGRGGADSGQLLVASTPRGGTYQVTLADNTKVWLNADSKLEFSSEFESKAKRIVKLIGEAYFEVAKNKTKPFIVESNGQRVEVLGTHFNINAYADEGIVKTTLLEGAVSVLSLSYKGNGAGAGVILKPNQQSVVSRAKPIALKNIDAGDVVAWKNGLFSYNNTTLGEVLRQAARWYDVTLTYEDDALKKKMLSGAVTRYDNISGLLNAISYTAGVKFKIMGRNVIVQK